MGGIGANVFLFNAVTLGGDVKYTGDQFAIDPVTGGNATLESAAIVNAYLSRRWSLGRQEVFTHLTTRLAVENAFDEIHYQQFGLPEPGRRFRIELRLD